MPPWRAVGAHANVAYSRHACGRGLQPVRMASDLCSEVTHQVVHGLRPSVEGDGLRADERSERVLRSHTPRSLGLIGAHWGFIGGS